MRRFGLENQLFIELLEKVKVEIHNPEQEECCICLNEPCVREEISFLPCFHSERKITWLATTYVHCVVCICPRINPRGLIEIP